MKINRREFLTGSLSSALIGWRQAVLAAGYPEYYAEHLAKASARINGLAATCEDGFWFMTDLHILSNRRKSGVLLAELVKQTPLKRVLCGGDLVSAWGEKFPTDRAAVEFAIDAYRKDWIAPIRNAGGLLYTAKGNHDFTVRHSSKDDGKHGFTMNGEAASRMIVSEFSEPGVITNPDDPNSACYYFDNPQAKLRYIVADSTDTAAAEDVPWGVRYGMHEPQLKWLETVAFAQAPADYGFVVMHHIPVTGVVGNDQDAKMFAPMRKLLEKYRGRVILDLTGHHHCEMETCQNGIWHVTNPCDAAYSDYITRSRPWCGDLPKKVSGTIAEQTFDALQIDRRRGLIHFTRIGGGQNRSIHTEVQTVGVGAKTKLSAGLLAGKVTWGCYDADRVANHKDPTNPYINIPEYFNDVATIDADGTLLPKKPGEIVVIARDADLNKEIFPMTVKG